MSDPVLIVEYRLDNYARNPNTLMMRIAGNCKARRLDKGIYLTT